MTERFDASNGQLAIQSEELNDSARRGLGSEAHQVGPRGLSTNPILARQKLTTPNPPKNNITTLSNNNKNTLSSRYPKITSRITRSLFDKLKTYAKLQGISLSTLIKNMLEKKELPKPSLTHEDALMLFKKLTIVGDEVNQIVRAINSGIYEGFYIPLEHIEQLLLEVDTKLARASGLR